MSDTPEAVIRQALEAGLRHWYGPATAALDALVAENARLTAELAECETSRQDGENALAAAVLRNAEALRVADELRSAILRYIATEYPVGTDHEADGAADALRRAALSSEGQPREKWPCGCVKGETPHGVGWKDCEFQQGADE